MALGLGSLMKRDNNIEFCTSCLALSLILQPLVWLYWRRKGLKKERETMGTDYDTSTARALRALVEPGEVLCVSHTEKVPVQDLWLAHWLVEARR